MTSPRLLIIAGVASGVGKTTVTLGLLEAFRRRGGRMIIWHGEADPLIFPRGTLNYFDRVAMASRGATDVKDFVRLFMAPGVGHCGGGDGPAPVGLLDAVVNWVEKGVAPATISASRRREDGTVLTRPLCAYPMTAKWTGRGSTDDAANPAGTRR